MKVCSVCRGSHQNSAACNGEFIPESKAIPEVAVDLIPGFRLDGLLTSTSSTATYRARDTASGRSCLVNIFTADEAGSKQILREAKVAAGLFHPGIAGFYEAGRIDAGRTFVASEDIDGRTLREVLDNVGSPDLLTTIEIIRQAAESLHALHVGGLIHGAINPLNIILSMSSGGGPVVRLQHPDLGRTTQRSIISNRFLIDSEIDSLRYFAPEQCSGDEASAQSDIYSLGIVFYEMLSGSPPFDAPTAVALIHQQRNQQPPEVKIENFNLRMLVTHALTEALHKQPRLRQSSANAFARQLRHIEQLATHSSTPPPAGVVPRASAPMPKTPAPILVSSPKHVKDTVGQIVASSSETIQMPTRDIEAEHISSPEIIASAEPESRQTEPVVEKVSAPKPVFVTPRSRLKVWKKKLHLLAARVAPETKTHVASILTPDDSKATDQTSIESLSTVEAPVRLERRKIQWETPEDDIPSEAMVLEVMANEGIEQVPAPKSALQDAIETPIVGPSKAKVEIPIVEKLPDEKPVETPVKLKPTLIDEKPVTAVKQKLPTPRKTISKPMPAAPKEKAPQVGVAASPVRMVPRMPDADTSRPSAKSQKSPRQRSGLGFKVNLADLEEITLVRPPSRRIKIDWERAVPRPDLSNVQPRRPQRKTREIDFSPTILGDAPDRAPRTSVRSEGMFSAFDGSSRLQGRRAVILGGGLLALMAFMVFGIGFVTEMFQTSNAADTETASSTLPSMSQQIAVPPAAIVPAKQKALTTSAAPISEKPVAETISISATVARPTNRSATSEVATEAKTKAAPKPRAASSDAASRTKEPKTDDRKRSERSVTPAFKPATFTRPRIVKTAPQ
jgi:serine/threonine protein kinase